MIAVTGVWGLHGRPRRVENYERFADSLRSQGVQLATVELAFDDDPFCTVSAMTTWIRGTRAKHDLFQKEALCALAMRGWAPDATTVAWIDADVLLLNPRWAYHAQQELNLFDVVQLFGTTRYCTASWDLGAETLGAARAFATRQQGFDDYARCHPGLAWAARGEWLRENPLYCGMPSGSNDTVMFKAFTGGMARLQHQDGMSPAWRRHAMEYCQRLEAARVGYVEGCAVHLNHGDLRARDYGARWRMPTFDPYRDLVVEGSGLLAWASDEARQDFEANRVLLAGT